MGWLFNEEKLVTALVARLEDLLKRNLQQANPGPIAIRGKVAGVPVDLEIYLPIWPAKPNPEVIQ